MLWRPFYKGRLFCCYYGEAQCIRKMSATVFFVMFFFLKYAICGHNVQKK